MWKNLVDIDSLQKIILFHHILENNWLQQYNFYYSFGSGIPSTIRCKPPTKRRCQTTLDQAHPLSNGSAEFQQLHVRIPSREFWLVTAPLKISEKTDDAYLYSFPQVIPTYLITKNYVTKFVPLDFNIKYAGHEIGI